MDLPGLGSLTGLGSLADLIKTGINKFVPDAEAKAANELAIDQLRDAAVARVLAAEMQTMQMQADINKTQAASGSLFVAGARPFIMWICGFAFLYVTIAEPIARFVAQVIYHYTGPFPAIDTSITMQALFGMLGLGAMRSFEKTQGVATTTIK